MPLIIIGLVFLIGILILQIAKHNQEKNAQTTSVRERYKEKFSQEDDESEEKKLYFPTEDVEAEKHKRNIN